MAFGVVKGGPGKARLKGEASSQSRRDVGMKMVFGAAMILAYSK